MSVLRNIGIGTVANATGQLAQLAFIPVVTRLVGPEVYGIFMVFQLSSAVVSLLAGVQYNSAIVLCSRRNQAAAVSALVAWLGVAVCSLLLLALAATLLAPEPWMRVPVWALPALLLFCIANTLQRIGLSLAVRAGGFRATALSGLANSLGMIGVQFWLLTRSVDGVSALVWGLVVGQWASLLPLASTLAGTGRELAGGAGSVRRVVWAAKRYARFPRYMLLFALNGALRDRLVQLLVGSYSNAGALGKLALAQRLITAPQSLLHQGISPVLFSFASSNPRQATSRIAAVLVELVCVATAPIFVIVYTELPMLSTKLLGSKWVGIDAYIGWLMLPSLLLVSTSFVDKLFDVFGQQKQLMILETVYSAVLLIALFAVFEMRLADWAICAYSVIFTLYLLVCVYMAFALNGLELRDLVTAMKWVLAMSGGYAVSIFCIVEWLPFEFRLPLAVLAYAAYMAIYVAVRGQHQLSWLRAKVGR